jgi:phage shock protein C
MATIPRQEKVLRRSRSHRIIGGVCGGLAEYFGVDPLLVRAIFVVIAIMAGSGLLLYILLWLLVPMEAAEATPAGT